MFKEEIMQNGEWLLAKMSKLLDESNNVEVYIEKNLFDDNVRRIDKKIEWNLYKELTFYQGRWNETSMLLEDYNSKYYRLRKFIRTYTAYVIPRNPKHTVEIKKAS